jgi:hypothetical protein
MCKGEGVIEVTCEVCHGAGEVQRCVSLLDVDGLRWANSEDKAVLKGLQADARRCREQAERLIAMNPRCAESYREQLEKTLADLNRQADGIHECV